MKPLQIRYISQTFGLGGAETFVSELLQELRQRKHRVTAHTNHQPFQSLLQKKHIRTGDIPIVFDIIGDWKGLSKAVFLLPIVWVFYGVLVWRERKADIILVSGFTEKLPVSWWAAIFSIPVVWIEFAPLDSVLNKFYGLPRVWYRLAARFPTQVVTASQHSLRGLLAEKILTHEQLLVIPCGREIAYSTNVLPKKPEIVCISRMEKGKGQDILVQIFSLVYKKIPAAHLTFVGEGSFLPSVKKLVLALQLAKAVSFAGRVPDALKILESARVCVVPSVWPLEGFGLVACEGMALRKPVVAFDHGPVNEIVLHNKTGLLAQDDNFEMFAKNIIRLLTDDELANRLGKAGRQRFEQHYTIQQVAQQYEKIFQKICQ